MQLNQEDITYLRTLHLSILTPMYAGLCYGSYTNALMQFQMYAQQVGLKFSYQSLSNESLITRGRNTLIAKAMFDKTVTHVLFIDADLAFSPEHIFKLLLHKKEMIAGLYPKKTLPPDFVVNCSPEFVGSDGQIKLENGLMPITRAGTGFLLISRETIEKLMIAYPSTKFNNNIGLPKELDEYMYNLFDCWVSTDNARELLSEDWAFCCRARGIGIDIWADPSVRIPHIGTFQFPVDGEFFKNMGIDLEVNKQLVPKIAVRPDEVSPDGKIYMPLQPDLDALKRYEDGKQVAKQFGDIVI